ncbi:hypothetical protein DM02DRAFT_596654 [Periconia macrospinosa]|uniref:ATP-grasp domain-containing protein n=1 Tax=Periconia macrospinosa TaxID=97972 RepID=A0A2V1DJ81_9PLEO|nr:hypothetical protein DM02DRAFT_596654 [Periconia macrospinosa]
MDQASKPTHYIYWASRTISPNTSQGQHHALRLLHVLLIPSSFSVTPDFHAQYPQVLPLSALHDESDKRTSRPAAYLLDQLAALSSSAATPRLYTFVLPYTSGFIIRSDFLSVRLQMLQSSYEVQSFPEPRGYCPSREVSQFREDVIGMLETAVGVISLEIDQSFDLQNLEHQLQGRLSYPWLSLHSIPERRIALLRGRPNYRVGRSVYSAAKTLGVSLIIIDEDKHWLQADTPRNKQLREAFLTIDMRENSTLPDRIAVAVKSYPAQIDGIFTLSDNYLVAVAQAAEKLGLPTCPSSAYEIAFDKGLTRKLHADPSEFATVKCQEDLLGILSRGDFRPQYPLILKPRTGGWNSQYVRKIRNKEDLFLAVQEICPRYVNGVVIEPYYEGPEIDVNIVMSDGKVIFEEIVDEPPSRGDAAGDVSADFLENGMRSPSMLPRKEQQSIFRSVSKDLLALGFTDGVFHVEARFSQSSMELRDENGLIDLVSTSPTPSEEIRCHLIEINARPPGLRAQILSKLTYGIDYFAIRILSAINDKKRVEAACHSFNLPQFPQGAQSWCQLVHLPVLQKGTAAGITAIQGLLAQLPSVAPYVVEYQCCFEPGETLPDPSEYVDVYGHCIVSSTKGRRHVVSMVDAMLRAYYESGAQKTVALSPIEEKPYKFNGPWESLTDIDSHMAATKEIDFYAFMEK